LNSAVPIVDLSNEDVAELVRRLNLIHESNCHFG
jgi:hypothetical protein